MISAVSAFMRAALMINFSPIISEMAEDGLN
jgi:hypothetical protein